MADVTMKSEAEMKPLKRLIRMGLLCGVARSVKFAPGVPDKQGQT